MSKFNTVGLDDLEWHTIPESSRGANVIDGFWQSVDACYWDTSLKYPFSVPMLFEITILNHTLKDRKYRKLRRIKHLREEKIEFNLPENNEAKNFESEKQTRSKNIIINPPQSKKK